MVHLKEASARPLQTVIQLFISVAAALCVMAVLTVLMAVLLLTKDYAHRLIPGFSWAILVCSSIVGGLLAGFLHQNKGFLMGLGSGLLLVLIVSAAAALLYGGPLGLSFWLKLTILPLCGMIGGMAGIRCAQHRKKL